MTIPEADFYACGYAERLVHETPEAAVEEMVDLHYDPEDDVAALIRKAGPLTVIAYRRKTVSRAWAEGMAERMVELLGEDYAEEYGDPDGQGSDGLSDDSLGVVMAAIVAACVSSKPWQCTEVGRVVLSPEEIEAMMREHRPDWFMEDPR